MSWLSNIFDAGGDLLTGNWSSIPDDLTASSPTSSSSGSSIWDSPALWSSIVGTGAQLFTNSQNIDASEQARKDALDQSKFQFLVDLAKLKYGNKGGGSKGGGGTARNKNADLISVLQGGTDNTLKALDQLSTGVGSALRPSNRISF